MRKIPLIFFFFCLLVMPKNANPANITLTWDQLSTATNYKIFYGEQSVLTNPSPIVYNVGNVLSCTISNLIPGHKYYFAFKAYNAVGPSDEFSNEVSWTVPQTETVIEDGKNSTNWVRTSGTGLASSVYNIDDDVIAFRSSGATASTVYRISLDETDITDDTIEWEYNYVQALNSYFVVGITTTFGSRNIYYRPIDTNPLGTSTNIHFGIGSAKKNGGWNTINRNIQDDLKTAQPTNNLISCDYFYVYVYGSGISMMLDNLIFYADLD